nr:deoxynucleotidyltransferase terminal interacting [Hymenolepis microstoma]
MDEEEDKILFSENSLWKPPINLSDCSSEYLKDNVIPYHLLKNPFKKEKCETVSEDYESRIWSRLGLLNDTDTKLITSAAGPSSSAHESSGPSLYYTRTINPILSKREIQRRRKSEKRSKLAEWFDLPRGDFSQENQEDREIVAMRNVLSSDLHTRKADGRRAHFHVGTVVDDPGSFYDRVPRKQRKKNLVDELLANAEYMKKQRRQYAKLQKEKQEKRAAAIRKMKQQQKRAGRTNRVEVDH